MPESISEIMCVVDRALTLLVFLHWYFAIIVFSLSLYTKAVLWRSNFFSDSCVGRPFDEALYVPTKDFFVSQSSYVSWMLVKNCLWWDCSVCYTDAAWMYEPPNCSSSWFLERCAQWHPSETTCYRRTWTCCRWESKTSYRTCRAYLAYKQWIYSVSSAAGFFPQCRGKGRKRTCVCSSQELHTKQTEYA